MLFQYTHSFHTIFFYILSFLQSASYPFLYHLLLYSLMLTGRFAPLFIPSSFIFSHSHRALRTHFYTIFFYILSFLQGASHPILYHLLLYSIMVTGHFTSLFYTIFFYILSFLQGASHPFFILSSFICYHANRALHIPFFLPFSFIFYHAYRALRTPSYTIFFYNLSCLHGASNTFYLNNLAF